MRRLLPSTPLLTHRRLDLRSPPRTFVLFRSNAFTNVNQDQVERIGILLADMGRRRAHTKDIHTSQTLYNARPDQAFTARDSVQSIRARLGADRSGVPFSTMARNKGHRDDNNLASSSSWSTVNNSLLPFLQCCRLKRAVSLVRGGSRWDTTCTKPLSAFTPHCIAGVVDWVKVGLLMVPVVRT